MSNVEQFARLVSDAGATVDRITQGPGGERLFISVRGGLIMKEIPLRGEFSEDASNVRAAAEQMVMAAKMLTGEPARNLSSPSKFDRDRLPPTSRR